MEVKVQKWGNSNGIRIPNEVLKELGIKTEDILSLVQEDNKIVISKIDKNKTLKELFDEYKGDFKPMEYDWGAPVGREIW